MDGEEQEPGGALADVVSVEEDGHRRRSGQVERNVGVRKEGSVQLLDALVLVFGHGVRSVAATVHVLWTM